MAEVEAAPCATGAVLVGEAKRHIGPHEALRLLACLQARAAGIPELSGRELLPLPFVLDAEPEVLRTPGVIGPRRIMDALAR